MTIDGTALRFKIPKRFEKKSWGVTVGSPVGATYLAGVFERFTIDVSTSTDQPLSQQKLIRQQDYIGYTECKDSIDGHDVFIQSFRGGGMILDQNNSSVPFAVAAVFEHRGQIVRFIGSVGTRQAQEDLLAIVRTVEFAR